MGAMPRRSQARGRGLNKGTHFLQSLPVFQHASRASSCLRPGQEVPHLGWKDLWMVGRACGPLSSSASKLPIPRGQSPSAGLEPSTSSPHYPESQGKYHGQPRGGGGTSQGLTGEQQPALHHSLNPNPGLDPPQGQTGPVRSSAQPCIGPIHTQVSLALPYSTL